MYRKKCHKLVPNRLLIDHSLYPSNLQGVQDDIKITFILKIIM